MVMNWRGWVVENELEYLSDVEATSPNVKRLGTRLVHDLPLKGARISIGDNYSSVVIFNLRHVFWACRLLMIFHWFPIDK